MLQLLLNSCPLLRSGRLLGKPKAAMWCAAGAFVCCCLSSSCICTCLARPASPKFTFSTLANLLFTEDLVIFLIFICLCWCMNRSFVVVPQSRDSCGGLRLRRKWEFDCHLSFHGNMCCSLIHELIFLPHPHPRLWNLILVWRTHVVRHAETFDCCANLRQHVRET